MKETATVTMAKQFKYKSSLWTSKPPKKGRIFLCFKTLQFPPIYKLMLFELVFMSVNCHLASRSINLKKLSFLIKMVVIQIIRQAAR